MSEPAPLPNPRRLYTQLRACDGPSARAQAVLAFMQSSTGAERGHLFLAQAGVLTHVASSSGAAPSAELQAEAQRAWDRELDRQPDDNKTLELSAIELMNSARDALFQDADEQLYERRLLSVYRGPSWVPVGMALLAARPDKALQPVRQLYIEALCSALLDAGDVSERPGGQAKAR